MPKHYAIFIKPISLIAHLLIINVAFLGLNFNNYEFLLFTNISWLLIAYFTKIYHYKRTINITDVVSQLASHFVIYSLILISYFALTDTLLNTRELAKVLGVIFIAITLFRAIYFSALRKYRIEGGNFRKVILIGGNKSLSPVLNFMMNRVDFGYKVMGFFSDDKNQELKYKKTNKALIRNGNGKIDFLGKVEECCEYAKKNHIDEI